MGGRAILFPVRLAAAEAPPLPLLLNGRAEVGEAKGGGGRAVKELVMETICCNGLPGVLVVKGMRGGGGRFEPDADCGVEGGEASDLLSSSLKLSLSNRVSLDKS